MDVQNSPMYQRIHSPVNEIKICIIIDSKTPILTRIPLAPNRLTLGTFKAYSGLNEESYKFYFKSHDQEFGTVKEEFIDDDSPLPVEDGRVVAWVISNSNPQQSTLFGSENPYDRLVDNLRSSTSNVYNLPVPTRINHSSLQEQAHDESVAPRSTTILTTLYLDQQDTLGLTILCPDNDMDHSGGLLINRVQPGSVAARGKRVCTGDRIVEINAIDLRHISTSEAVMVFKQIVENKGAIRLTLQRVGGDDGLNGGTYTVDGPHANSSVKCRPRDMPRPANGGGFDPATELPPPMIDPEAFLPQDRYDERKAGHLKGTYSLPRSLTPRSLYTTSNFDAPSIDLRPTLDSQSVYGPATPSSLRQIGVALHCSKDSIGTIYAYLKSDAASLDIKDREWLKVVVKNAFLGSTLVKWLSRNVYGFCSRSDTKRYANKMLNLKLIKSPMSAGTFSEKCYYVLT